MSLDWTIPIRKDLSRLARFGANISDAYSCFIFLPELISEAFSQKNAAVVRGGFSRAHTTAEASRSLEMFGGHSLSNEVIPNCKLSCENGLIGWVAKHNRSIHVSPFEHDSRTLGVYGVDQQLKSFIGIPVNLDFLPPSLRGTTGSALSGVIACDSKKTFAFSKLQGKLLEDLSAEVANTFRLLLQVIRHSAAETSWSEFISRAEEFTQALGPQSICVLRLKLNNFTETERALGGERAVRLLEQVYRLILQSVPPHLPSFRLPNGEMIFVVDTMMIAFYENKIRAICSHSGIENSRIAFSFFRTPFKKVKSGTPVSIEGLIRESAESSVPEMRVEVKEEAPKGYEYRRA